MLVLILCFAALTHVLAQEVDTTGIPPNTVRVTLTDGTSHIGIVEGESDEEVHLRTLSGIRMTIPRDQIRSIVPFEGQMRDGKLLTQDPNYTRLLFAPTARPLRAGQGYFAAYELFFPFIAVGATDRINLAGGISLIPGLSGQLVYVAPKVTFLTQPGVNLGAGVLAGTFVGDTDDEDFPVGGLVYALGTFGQYDAAVTVGAGFAFTDEETADRPVIMLGGEYQVSNSVKLISENYFVPGEGEGIVISGGIRFFGERLAADLALFTVLAALDEGGFPFLPWLGFAYNFGHNP